MGIINAKLRVLDKVDNTADADKSVKYSSISNTITETKVFNTNFKDFFDLNENIHKTALKDEELNVYRLFSATSDDTTGDPNTYSSVHDLPAVDNHIMCFGIDGSNRYTRVIDFDIRSSDIYTRCKFEHEWDNWSKLLNSKNYTDYAASKDHTHDYLPLNGGTMSGLIMMNNSLVATLDTNPGVNGSILVAQIKPGPSYQNASIEFEIIRRGDLSSTFVYVQFSPNSGNPDPDLASFKAVGCTDKIYIVKSDTSTWDMYIRKNEPYDSIEVLSYHKPSYMNDTSVTFPGTFIDTVPTGYTQVTLTKLPYKSGTIALKEDVNTTITDWNEAVTSAFYKSSAGASNIPVSNVAITGNVFATGSMIVQVIYPESNDDTELVSYTRKGAKNDGIITWSNWIKHCTITEDDDIYTIKGYDASTYSNLFYKAIPSTVTNIIFTNKEMPSDATLIDVNKNKNGKLVAWVNNKATTMYISTQKVGIKVKPNKDNNGMINVYGLQNVNFSNFDTSNLASMSHMFTCNDIKVLNMSVIKTDNVTDMSYMFSGTSKLTRITGMQNWNTNRLTNMDCMFQNCNYLQELDMSSFDTSSVTNMRYLFYYCKRLTSILGLIGFDTSNVTNMGGMFSYCEAMQSLDISNFNTSNVINMHELFSHCSSLTELSINFDTGNVTDMGYMFSGCTNLLKIPAGGFNTANVKDMSSMFADCTNAKSISGLSDFDVSNVTNMYSMFEYCSSLTELDLSSWNTNSMSSMFSGCNSLTTIKVGNTFKWITTLKNLGLRSGTWQDEEGNAYTSTDTFPSNAAHTYTKVS